MAKCYKCMPNWSCDEENKMCEPKQTNADRIRAMSDEELAEFISCCGCPDHARDCTGSCKDCTMEWLKQPAEDQ